MFNRRSKRTSNFGPCWVDYLSGEVERARMSNDILNERERERFAAVEKKIDNWAIFKNHVTRTAFLFATTLHHATGFPTNHMENQHLCAWIQWNEIMPAIKPVFNCKFVLPSFLFLSCFICSSLQMFFFSFFGNSRVFIALFRESRRKFAQKVWQFLSILMKRTLRICWAFKSN